MRQVQDEITLGREVRNEPVAQPVETYVRPEKENAGELEQIAESLVAINPEIQKFIAKKEEEKQGYEAAMGAKMFLQASADGKEHTTEEIRQMFKNGDLKGPYKWTQWVKEGVDTERHKAMGRGIEGHMQKWIASQPTVTLKDGTQTTLDKCTDENICELEYQKELSRFVAQSSSGGVYDPVLYQKYVAPYEEAAHTKYIDTMAQFGIDRIEEAQRRNVADSMDGVIGKFIDNNAFIANKEGSTIEAAQQLHEVIEGNVMNGMERGLAVKEAYYTLINKMGQFDIDNIEGLVAVAKQMPEFKDNPQIISKLQEQASETKKLRLEEERRKEYQEEIDNKHFAEDSLIQLVGATKTGRVSDIPQAEIDKLIKANPKATSYINDMLQDDNKNKQITSYEMNRLDNDTFRHLQARARSGEMSMQEVMKYKNLPDDQWEDLYGHVVDGIQFRRSSITFAERHNGEGRGEGRQGGTLNYASVVQAIRERVAPDYNNMTVAQRDRIDAEIEKYAPKTYDVLNAMAAGSGKKSSDFYINSEKYLRENINGDVIKAINFRAANPSYSNYNDTKALKAQYKLTITSLNMDVNPHRSAEIKALNQRIAAGKGKYQPTGEDIKLIRKSFGPRYKSEEAAMGYVTQISTALAGIERLGD